MKWKDPVKKRGRPGISSRDGFESLCQAGENDDRERERE